MIKRGSQLGLRSSTTLAALVTLQACDLDASVGRWAAPRDESPRAGVSAPEPMAGVGDVPVEQDPAPSRDAGLPPPIATAAGGSGAADASGFDAAVAPMPDACHVARDASATLAVTVLDPEAVVYNFADGARFPAGRYRISYVDGCRRYDATGAWTVHASLLASGLSSQGRGGCYLVMSNGQALDLAPGTTGVVVGEGTEPAGAFATYPECVAANLMVPALELAFTGGTLGIMNAGDSTQAKTRGEDVGGRSPTYRLTRLDACP